MGLLAFIGTLIFLLIDIYALVACILFVCSLFANYFEDKSRDTYTIMYMSAYTALLWPVIVYREVKKDFN